MIQLKNITKTFTLNNNQIVALNNINLTFNKGEIILLQGASGSGKSTILSLIARLSKPTTGEVIVNNQRVSKLNDDFASIYRRENIGFIFQKFNLIPNLTVKDNIILPLIPLNLPQNIIQEKLDIVMEKFSISHKQDIIVKSLSGGEQQRVAIARGYINDPKIILADEPTANLDKKLSEDFIKLLKDLKSKDKTIIIATHDPLFLNLDFIDHIYNISNGQII